MDDNMSEAGVEGEINQVGREPRTPRPILKLSEDVVNQIAAAEIIHRPANAIKELIENSLDAGSTSIKVSLKDGGLKMLQIQDNGSGIRKSDLPLLCERFATSKITTFSDLESLTTYGFRGEALASVSFVSRMHVTTKVRGEACGWKAFYKDGRLVDANGVERKEGMIKPTAANDGTMIVAEDLFYNVPLRRKSFKSPSEEYNRVIDVVTRYAIHNPHVAWVCKKAGSTIPEVSTPSNSTTKANIGLLYGSQLARELLHVQPKAMSELGVVNLEGWVSNANWNQKRMVFLLFINHRLVDSIKIRKAVDALYTSYLPKGTFPFVYLSLEIEPSKIDVNVHPTKQEVHFLNEEEIVDGIVSEVTRSLVNANASRTYEIQTLLPGAPPPVSNKPEEKGSSASQKPAPQFKVRMDYQDRTLESMQMFAKVNPSQMEHRPSKRRRLPDETHADEDESGQIVDIQSDTEEAEESSSSQAQTIQESKVALKSIKSLRKKVLKEESPELTEIMCHHQFVGLVPDCPMGLVQEKTKLYLVEYDLFADELFYQLALRQFGAFSQIELEPAPLLKDLVKIAIDHDPDLAESKHNPDDVLEVSVSRLMERREMLQEYFSLVITEDGRLEAIPNLLPGYLPDLHRLPFFLMCAGVRVNWTDELECFETLSRELAYFFSPRTASKVKESGIPEDSQRPIPDYRAYQIEHHLFPAFRRYAHLPRKLLDRSIRQIANLPDLYKVFERC